VARNEVMTQDEVDQCGLFHVDGDGGVTLSMCFLGRKPVDPPVRLLWGVPAER